MKNPFGTSNQIIYQILFDRIQKEANPQKVLNEVNTFISKQSQIVKSLYDINDVVARRHVIESITKDIREKIKTKNWIDEVKTRVDSILIGKIKECINYTNYKITLLHQNQINRCNKEIDDESFQLKKFFLEYWN